MRLTAIDEKLKTGNRKVYVIEKDIERLKQKLKKVPKGFFHRKERREMEDKIASNLMRLEKEKSRLDAIPMMSDFATVAVFKKALKQAKADLTAKEQLQEEWNRLDSKPEAVHMNILEKAKREPVHEQPSAKKYGIKERLAERKIEIEKQFQKPKQKKSRDRDCL